jgi:hypothetical protein
MTTTAAVRALRRGSASALVLALALSAAALGAGALKGGTYSGTLVRAKVPIVLKVAKNGKSVTVKVERPPLYCEGGGVGTKQITRSAVAISKGGSFTATLVYEFPPTHSTGSKLVVKGKFSGHKASGSARSEFQGGGSCDGSTSFSAKAR